MNKQVSSSEEDVVKSAFAVRELSYSPYSKFKVGAALLTGGNRIFNGCNVENISFGLTICAERAAVGAAVSTGSKDFQLLVIAADSTEPIVPCGACRQVLAEFCPDLRIISVTLAGARASFFLDVLFPLPHQGILK